jgi:serine/threonine protein kinase
MKCQKCHSENPDTQQFCGGCGARLPKVEEFFPSITKTLETPMEELTTGSTFAGRYQIIDVLGKGGMGKVYRVLDIKLNEEVALKLIKPEISSDKKVVERFCNELKISRQIVHKNVARMFDLNEEKGTQYFTMEYVKGEDLKKLIRKMGQLGAAQAIPIAKQICEGMEEAHRLGVVHRDLKPQNVMVDEDGNARIMDFGIALSLELKGITGAGVMIGTPEYMSPEQIEGMDVDQRSDIYSLGIILYEMVTGRVPFEGDTPLNIAYKHKHDTPQDPSKINARVPEELSRVILRCLEKEKGKRYQSAGEVRSELIQIEKDIPTTERIKPKRRPITSKEITVTFGFKKLLIPVLLVGSLAIAGLFIWSPWKQKESITIPSDKSSLSGFQRLAVLPFANIKDDPLTDYLGFALADQIIGDLSYVKNVLARPSSAIRQYQDEEVDVQAAGNALEVDFIVMGHYLKEGDVLRLNIELVDVHSNEMIWREPIEVRYENVFELQDLVTKKVIDGLKTKFFKEEQGRIQTDVPQNPVAYEYYLRSIPYPLSNEGDQLAIEMLKKSIELDPNYAPAYAQLGDRIHRLAQYGLFDSKETQKAEKYFLKALSLNPELLSALGNLAMFYTETARIEEAVELTRKMLEINPNNAEVHYTLGYIYRYAGMLDESVLEMELAVALDPKNPGFRTILLTYITAGEYKKAVLTFKNYNENALTLELLGTALFLQGDEKQALKVFDRIITMEPDGLPALVATGSKAFIEGNREKGLAATRKLEKANLVDAEAWFALAQNYGLLGDRDGCIRALQRAVDGGYFNYPYMLTDYYLDPMRDDLEFQRILEKAKAKHEAFKKKFFPERYIKK